MSFVFKSGKYSFEFYSMFINPVSLEASKRFLTILCWSNRNSVLKRRLCMRPMSWKISHPIIVLCQLQAFDSKRVIENCWRSEEGMIGHVSKYAVVIFVLGSFIFVCLASGYHINDVWVQWSRKLRHKSATLFSLNLSSRLNATKKYSDGSSFVRNN